MTNKELQVLYGVVRPSKLKPEDSQELTERDLERLFGIDCVLKSVVRNGLVYCPHQIVFPRHCGKRTAEEQKKLFLKKRSKCDGTKKVSYHQSGRAFDFAVLDDEGNPTWSKEYYYKYKAVARHFQKVARRRFNTVLEWGGDWKSWKDRPHLQLPKLK